MKLYSTLSLAAALFAGGLAQAAEMTIYQFPNYGGNHITLRNTAPIISDLGYTENTGSVVVHSGNWRICSAGHFTGHCVDLRRGEYPRLDSRFERITSVMDIGDARPPIAAVPGGAVVPPAPPPPPVVPVVPRYGRGSIQFFDQPDFRGSALTLDRDAPNFVERGYNDRATSLVIHEGSWELCTNINYSGRCRIYGPGRYADLGPGMDDRLSSARLVRNAAEAPATMQGGWGRVPPNETGRSRVILFGEERLRGPSIAVSDTMVNLQNARFNDAAESMIVEGGSWLACSDAYFRGSCHVFGPGRYERLRDTGLTRMISSLRPTSPEPVGRRWGGAEGIQLFKGQDFAGESRTFAGDTPNLRGTGYNDRAGSMVVNAGEWELCSEAGYAGSCMTVGPGAYANLGGLSASLSSLRRLR